MNIYISRQAVSGPWGGGNRWLKAFISACLLENWHVVCSVAQADIAFIAAVSAGSPVEPGAVQVATEAIRRGIPCIFRVNDCDARKATDNVDREIKLAAKHCTHVVYVSRWLAAYAAARGVVARDQSVILNGVDTTVFHPNIHLTRSKADTLRIVTHHWSANRAKGGSWYEAIDALSAERDVTLTYIGRHACTFSKRTIVIPACDGEILANAIGKNDLYISGSLYDPGPNHILEAAALGMPMIVSAQGGGCVEFASPAPAAASVEEMVSLIKNSKAARSILPITSWDECTATYVRLVKDVVNHASR